MNSDFTATVDPNSLFSEWLGEAEAAEPNDPNAMALATVDASGMPNVRMVLLKGHDAKGFVFFTNFESIKGRELLAQGKPEHCSTGRVSDGRCG
jgi:pyridoxamine 5'-phosphate oxidase